MTIEMFAGPKCPYCARAKDLLNEKGLTFTERDISNPEILSELKERFPRQKSIPQIFIDGEHIGGYDDLRLKLT